MRKISLLLAFVMIAVCNSFAQNAKYVFYFIGDGMGVNQVEGTELYQAELKGKIGIEPLVFTQFPVFTNATTYSATNGVTDSAASGTALATGSKSKNGTLGMLKDHKTNVNSVAVWAKEEGMRVGIATSVSIDHATPASFYAHVPYRKMYYEIGKDLCKSDFDFFAGSDFKQPKGKKNDEKVCLYDLAEKNGYTFARGYNDYLKKCKDADKMILLQTEEASKKDRACIPYAIDRDEDDLTLKQITTSAIDFLTKDNDKGFFLMVEGGKIDWACHANDAATAFREIQDFDEAIKEAYKFYQKHPDETLIVITADHETGGFVLGTGKYELNLQVLQNQKVSEAKFTQIIKALRKKYSNDVPWTAVKEALAANFGFWNKVEITDEEEQQLKQIYDDSFKKEAKMEENLYAKNEPIAAEAKRIMSKKALIGWTSHGHSAGYVPVIAIGSGSKLFEGRRDNAEIPVLIAKAAGYTCR